MKSNKLKYTLMVTIVAVCCGSTWAFTGQTETPQITAPPLAMQDVLTGDPMLEPVYVEITYTSGLETHTILTEGDHSFPIDPTLGNLEVISINGTPYQVPASCVSPCYIGTHDILYDFYQQSATATIRVPYPVIVITTKK